MRTVYTTLTLRGRFCVLCPLHQEFYRSWCYLCSRVIARQYGWNARPICWYVEPEEGERLIRPVRRALEDLRN